jgi:hypothetical protein
MAVTETTVRGAVTADGQLVLDGNLDMPPGRVEVIVRRIQDASGERRPMLETLKRIWAEQEARGFRGRSAEEIIADVDAMRDEWEERQQGLEDLQDRLQAERARRTEEAEQP